MLFMDGEKVISEYNGDSDIDHRIRKRLQDIWAITKGKPKLTQAEEESEGESTVLPKFADDPRRQNNSLRFTAANHEGLE